MAASWHGDLQHTDGGGQSIAPILSVAAASFGLVGAAVDLLNAEGPISFANDVGATTGTPDSFTVTFKLQEAKENPASLGTPLSSDWSDVVMTDNPATLVFTTASTGVIATTWFRQKRFVRVVATVAFVNGTSPKIGVSARILARKKISGSGTGTQL